MAVLANPTGVRVSVGASQVTIATNTNNLYPTEQMKKIKLCDNILLATLS